MLKKDWNRILPICPRKSPLLEFVRSFVRSCREKESARAQDDNGCCGWSYWKYMICRRRRAKRPALIVESSFVQDSIRSIASFWSAFFRTTSFSFRGGKKERNERRRRALKVKDKKETTNRHMQIY
jgi:hypothetical protein